MPSYSLLVYGTLRDPQVQEAVIGRCVVGRPARLYGYEKRSLRQGAAVYPILVEASAAHFVDGHILSVTDEELRRMDEYEGHTYRRIRVAVDGGEECWVYAE